MKKEYKTHREESLLSRETAMLPESMPYAEVELTRRKIAAYHNQLTNLNNSSRELSML